MSDMRRDIAECLQPMPVDTARRLVRQTASRLIENRIRPSNVSDAVTFTRRLADCSETLGGIGKRPRVRRSPAVQQRYVERLTDPGLTTYLKTYLLGQDTAIGEQVEKLRRQVLTCPLHKPLRVGALGPTGTGKSECAALLARWLDVPFVNIDAASMPDAHTAMSQMLGSGRGIVDSDQAGRLEQVAKHHEGVVVELSDIDHAIPTVRTAVTDLALQLLQTGEAQAAKGHMFSCANLLLVFTLNLPDGKDERVFQPMGFGLTPTLDEVRKDVRRELKRLFSTAFWGRVGDPVLFGPLEHDVRIEIVRRCLEEAAVTAMDRLCVRDVRVEASTDVAARLLTGPGAPASHLGARGLLELARQHAAYAAMHLTGITWTSGHHVFELTMNGEGEVVLRGKK